MSEPPILHSSLSPEFQARAKKSFEAVGKYIEPTYELWELGFMRDADPERELALWGQIESVFKAYLREHCHGKLPAHVDARMIVGSLCRMSSNSDRCQGISRTVETRLRAIWKRMTGS